MNANSDGNKQRSDPNRCLSGKTYEVECRNECAMLQRELDDTEQSIVPLTQVIYRKVKTIVKQK